MFNKKSELKSFATGEIIPLESVKDEVFSTKMMGQGLAINSEKGEIYAPLAGIVTAVFPTQHALGITTSNNIEYIIHIGINTLEMDGAFKSLVQVGEKVKEDQVLVEYNYSQFVENDLDKVVILVFPTQVKIDVFEKSAERGKTLGFIKL